MSIVCVCGLRRSGKDTIANILKNDHGYKVVKIAGLLKDMLKTVFNFTDEQLEGDLKEELDPRWGVTPRKVMQFMGTEVMQFKIQELLPDIGRMFWTRAFIERYLPANNTDNLVISDIRFLHEYEELKKHTNNIRVIRVLRQGCNLDDHASEKEYLKIPVDNIIENDGTIEDLREKVNSSIHSWSK